MREDNELVVGDKVEMLREKDVSCKTMIEDMTGNGLYLTGVPIKSGRYVPLRVGEVVSLVFYRETGRHSTKMRVVGFERKGEIRYAWLYQLTIPTTDQRREAFRVSAIINIQVCKYLKSIERDLLVNPDLSGVPVFDSVVSTDLSVTGLSLITKRIYEPGEKYLLKLMIEESRGKISPFGVAAEVARFDSGRSGSTYYVGMRFLNQTKRQSEYLSKYILTQQQKLIKYRRHR